MARRIGLCARAVALAGCASLWISAPAAAQGDPRTDFDIPAQDLGAGAEPRGHPEPPRDRVQRGSRPVAQGACGAGKLFHRRGAAAAAGRIRPARPPDILGSDPHRTGVAIRRGSRRHRQRAGSAGRGGYHRDGAKGQGEDPGRPHRHFGLLGQVAGRSEDRGRIGALRGTPNVSFTKTNFASYNFQIRGIGTQALSVTTDPAVAISFNIDADGPQQIVRAGVFRRPARRGAARPQGTLYGRNATAGVVNMIPTLADPDRLAGSLKLETGNYATMRASGMLNIPSPIRLPSGRPAPGPLATAMTTTSRPSAG